jgi:hypothetical protein
MIKPPDTPEETKIAPSDHGLADDGDGGNGMMITAVE